VNDFVAATMFLLLTSVCQPIPTRLKGKTLMDQPTSANAVTCVTQRKLKPQGLGAILTDMS
jgi:hypothetical protein